jgi:lipoate-protein ligase A
LNRQVPTPIDAAGEQAWNAQAMARRPVEVASRVWLWPRAAIVLGCAQRRLHDSVRNRVGAGVEVLAREAGGGAVLVGPWMIGVSLVLPSADPRAGRSPTDGYRWLSLRLTDVLRDAGCDARALSPDALKAGSTAPTVPWACFGSLSAWEIVDGQGRKLVGLAQRRTREAVLLVAGILATEPDWALLCEALGAPADVERLQALTAACLPAGARVETLAERIESAIGRD